MYYFDQYQLQNMGNRFSYELTAHHSYVVTIVRNVSREKQDDNTTSKMAVEMKLVIM